ncbi:hypothetical protein BGZ61DRAFT_441846 [Ilyonectria robusta]|uniref:uncharacterized protein n=1 Tax=Ilyonectria robusta TaxID=1079257 RepID=UPI001E8CDDC3|nr:uncharacterized protein BGZ61DRAFT_441846 [Ilyonectria robusta]KAH8736330.1 hypothetical protein BGZ61DRAFT_441846 [Ilyonectria robusta]
MVKRAKRAAVVSGTCRLPRVASNSISAHFQQSWHRGKDNCVIIHRSHPAWSVAVQVGYQVDRIKDEEPNNERHGSQVNWQGIRHVRLGWRRQHSNQQPKPFGPDLLRCRYGAGRPTTPRVKQRHHASRTHSPPSCRQSLSCKLLLIGCNRRCRSDLSEIMRRNIENHVRRPEEG